MKEDLSSGYFCRLAAGFLLIAALGLMVHSLRAREAFALYHDVKYGTEREEGKWLRTISAYPEVMEACNRAHALYPYNYNLSYFAAGVAYASRNVENDRHYWRMLTDAHTWTDRGLEQNGRFRPLVYQKTDLLEKYGDRDSAIELLNSYTHWEYWHPQNHARLAILYAREGRLDEARAALLIAEHAPVFCHTAREAVKVATRMAHEEDARWKF